MTQSDTFQTSNETIVAQATAPGRGSIGVIRVSGPLSSKVASALLSESLKPRHAHHLPFLDENGLAIDEGLALFFPGPNSFTGEDVLELQGHGGQVILDMLMRRICKLGVRMARPGEFSERAFLNDKMDLTQAEAIADLIDSTSEQAARNAVRSLQGAFSIRIQVLVEALTQLRIYVEAAIDFPEEEIDFLSDGKVQNDMNTVMASLEQVFSEAQQGSIMSEGMTVVIGGRPNAGKSSLLNILVGRETAIVTDIAGTTRDVLREHIHIDGMPLHIIDTAGLRDSDNRIENIGVERAFQEISQADRVLLMVDASTTDSCCPHAIWPEFHDKLPQGKNITLIRNKIDLTGEAEGIKIHNGVTVIRLCAKTNQGIDVLKSHLKDCMGYTGTLEGGFSARRRHIESIEKARNYMNKGKSQLSDYGAGELLAEDLRNAQKALGEITGVFSSDDLLGRIFSSFCIGK